MAKYLLIGALFLFVGNSFSQQKNGWSFGAQAGLSATLIKFETPRAQPRIAPTLGLCANYQISKHFNIMTEVSYVLSSSQSKDRTYYGADAYNDFEMKTTIQYLSLPLIFNYQLPLFMGKLWLGAGSEFRYALDSKVKPSLTAVRPTSTITVVGNSVDIQENTNFILVSPIVQVTMDALQIKKGLLRTSLRYSVSLNDPIQNSAPPEIINNYSVQFGNNKLHAFGLIFSFVSKTSE